MIDILEGAMAAVLTAAVSGWGFIHRRIIKRLDRIDKRLEDHAHQLDFKMSRDDVKEVVADKMAPIHVTLKAIKEDLDEISKDVKELAKR